MCSCLGKLFKIQEHFSFQNYFKTIKYKHTRFMAARTTEYDQESGDPWSFIHSVNDYSLAPTVCQVLC